MTCDVTLVINLHREGRLAWRTIKSAVACCEDAESNHIGTEILLYLDKPDDDTHAIAIRAQEEFPGVNMVVDYLTGDLGLARNLAVEKADGRYITFLDGDDLTSRTWITNAFDYAEELHDQKSDAVLHRQFMLKFGDGLVPSICEQPSSDRINIDWLLTENLWCSSVFAHHDVFEKVKYKSVSPGFNFEDWTWHCDVLASGIPIIAVHEEVVFVRNKAPELSLGQQGYRSRARANASELFSRREGWNTHNPPLMVPTSIPQDTVDTWQEIHGIEPSTWPQDVNIIGPSCTELHGAYTTLLACFELRPTVIFAVNRLGMGGLEQAMLWHIQAMVDAGETVMLMIADAAKGNAWLSKLPIAVNVVNLRGLLPDVTDPKLMHSLVSRILVQFPPRVLSIHNCNLMWNILTENPAATCSKTNVFVTTYCGDIVRTHQSVHVSGAGFDSLNKVYDHIAGAFFDGESFKDELRELYGYDDRKLYMLNHPVVTQVDRARRREPGQPLRILWAARCDAQKRPELALAVMAECAKRKLPVNFECWGLTPDGKLPMSFELLTNTAVMGEFNGFDSLPIERYDAYLYTAEWDGASILVRSACGAGLSVVTAGNGAVGEIDIHLIAEDEVRCYVERINELCDHATLKMDQARCHAAVKHLTMDRFISDLKSVPGYIHE